MFQARTAFLIILAVLCVAGSAPAEMEVISDKELNRITAGSGGLSLLIKDIEFSIEMDSFSYTDSDGSNSIIFNNLQFHDGSGGFVWYDSGEEDITFDIVTIDEPSNPIDGMTLLVVDNPDWHQIYHVSAQNIIFCGTDLGSFDIGNIERPGSLMFFGFSGHGLLWEHEFNKSIEEIRYTYNDPGDFLNLTGIYLNQSVAGAPEDPATWVFDGAFIVGDLAENNPATLDIVTIPDFDTTSLLINIPMSGSIRVQDVQFGGQDFGPSAIDGIRVHHFHMLLPGGN